MYRNKITRDLARETRQ